MKKTNVLFKSLLVMSTSFVLIGCGGGSGGGNSESATETGYFIDSPVVGLDYNTSSGIKGKTEANGAFKYKKGDEITFGLGNKIILGSTQASGIITPLDIVSTDDPNNPKVLNIVSFLLSLDKDGNENNGIEIDENKIPDIQTPYDFSKNDKVPDNINNLISGYLNKASSHIQNSLNDITSNYIAGNYIGTYKTIENKDNYCTAGGSISLKIDKDGNAIGIAETREDGETYQYNLSGIMKYKILSVTGQAAGVDGTAEWKGTWDNDTITGTWSFKSGDGTASCSGKFSMTKKKQQ